MTDLDNNKDAVGSAVAACEAGRSLATGSAAADDGHAYRQAWSRPARTRGDLKPLDEVKRAHAVDDACRAIFRAWDTEDAVRARPLLDNEQIVARMAKRETFRMPGHSMPAGITFRDLGPRTARSFAELWAALRGAR